MGVRELAVWARTSVALGWRNLLLVAWYRAALRFGVHRVQRVRAPKTVPGPYFRAAARVNDRLVFARTLREWQLFGWFSMAATTVPDWHRDPFRDSRVEGEAQPWWRIPDFAADDGDIKATWEASRFDWVLHLAVEVLHGQDGAREKLNGWLADWSARNPPYLGCNWKCGQEASLRVMHLAVASLMLDEVHEPLDALRALVRQHLLRIEPTRSYAKAQDNNHGTSEAVALFAGGSWLRSTGGEYGRRLENIGRNMLAERTARLVAPDGSFSQYSTSYHRLLLDTLCVAELWRRRIGAEPFPEVVYDRAKAATTWLLSMVDQANGTVPNIGANDGVCLLPLTTALHSDYRPSLQLAAVLFFGKCAFSEAGPWDDMLFLLGVERPETTLPAPHSAQFDGGGFAVLRVDCASAVLRYPRFRFRPSQADALHVDLSVAGANLLRDAGTFSYALREDEGRLFSGVKGHNTVQFDEREQMPKLGRFLWGDWLKTTAVTTVHSEHDAVVAGAEYRDAYGVTHERLVHLRRGSLVVRDRVQGLRRSAVVRWRLRPARWTIDGFRVTDGEHLIVVTSTVPISRIELVHGWESRLYLQRQLVPVLEVEVASDATIETHYQWVA